MPVENQQIGPYTLVKKLGQGGFGEVWLAEKRTKFVTKNFAVKLPLKDTVDADAVKHEATLWEQASGHPNVLPIIDADEFNGQIAIVSEYAPDGSLADLLKKQGRLSVEKAVEMIDGILTGLDFLHSRKIIHRDLKPENVLLQGNTPRLADFGISRLMNTLNISSEIIGTSAYMSPESFDGKRNIQTDIWSVGIVFYQLLTGKLPFSQNHPTERMFAILTKDFEPLPDSIPQILTEIVKKSLSKLPENRFQTANIMSKALKQFKIHLFNNSLINEEFSDNEEKIFFDSDITKQGYTWFMGKADAFLHIGNNETIAEQETLVRNLAKTEGQKLTEDNSSLEEMDFGQILEEFEQNLQQQIWEEIENAYINQTTIRGRVVGKAKGGLQIDINGIEAFLPGSQVELYPVSNLDQYIGQFIKAKILKFNRRRENIILSRKVLLENY